MKRCLITMCFAFLAVSAVLAQEKKTVPPPPRPVDEGPNLAATMKFIQDKLNDIGPVNYVVYVHDDVAGESWTHKFKTEVTEVAADPDACRITYRIRESMDGTASDANRSEVLLKYMGDVVVMNMEQFRKEVDTAADNPSYSSRVDPPVFVLKVRFPSKKDFYRVDFLDEDAANRAAKAIVHAIELCGGGSKPELF